MPLVSRLRAHTPKGKAPRKLRAALEQADLRAGQSQLDGSTRASAVTPATSQTAKRLDSAVVEQGLATNRTRAQRLIEAGAVRVDGRVERKPARRVSAAARLLLVIPSTDDNQTVDGGTFPVAGAEFLGCVGTDSDSSTSLGTAPVTLSPARPMVTGLNTPDSVTEPVRTDSNPADSDSVKADRLSLLALRYVSRGALKLLGALDSFGSQGLTSPCGRLCLDIGASTGGFTQVLLERGAAQVIALDVGHGQLSPLLARDARVVELSGTNIRTVDQADLPFRPEYIVSDVSFISLTYVIPVIARLAAPGAEIVLLVKPQFEVGRGGLGKNGVVTDETARQQSLERVKACAQAAGLSVMDSQDSPIEGTHGNQEYLLWLRRPGQLTEVQIPIRAQGCLWLDQAKGRGDN